MQMILYLHPRAGSNWLGRKQARLAAMARHLAVPVDRRQIEIALEVYGYAVDYGKQRQLTGIHLGRRIAQRLEVLADFFSFELQPSFHFLLHRWIALGRFALAQFTLVQLTLLPRQADILLHQVRKRSINAGLANPLADSFLIVDLFAVEPPMDRRP